MTGIFRQRWHPKTRPRWIASLPVSEEVDETVSLVRLAGIVITENIPGTAVEESVSLGIILRCTEREPLNINENVTLSIFSILQTNDQALVQDAFSLLRQLSEENSSSIGVVYSVSLDKNNGFVTASQSIENGVISLEYIDAIIINNQLNAIDITQIDKYKEIITEEIIDSSELVASIPDLRGINILNNIIIEESICYE